MCVKLESLFFCSSLYIPPSPPLPPSPQEPLDPSEPPPPPEVGSSLTVMYDFEAQDRAELTVAAGQEVILRCPHDRVGSREWWLVDCGDSAGYVPANFLHYHGNAYT